MKSYDELQGMLKPTKNLLKDHPEIDPKAWMNLIKREMELGDNYYNKGEIDEAYLRYFFIVQMTLEVVPKHKKFSTQDNQYQLLRSNLGTIVTKLEQIKIELKGLSSSAPATETQNNASQIFNSAISSKFPSLASRNEPVMAPFKSTSTVPTLSGISAIEILTLLANSNPKILFIDIRPLEEYIQGHIGWRSSQNSPTAGLINIEPDWLKEDVSVSDIEQYLTSFGSSSNSAKLLLDSRAQMDLIVFYDNDSRRFKPGSAFELLYLALYSDILSAPKVLPKVLSGGYIAWNYFVANSKDLVNADWVEIGEGNGVRPFEMGKMNHSKTASNGNSFSNNQPPSSSNNHIANGNVDAITGGYHSTFNSYNYVAPTRNGNFQENTSATSLNLHQKNASGSQDFNYPNAPSISSNNFQQGSNGNIHVLSNMQKSPSGNLSGSLLSGGTFTQPQQQSSQHFGTGLNNHPMLNNFQHQYGTAPSHQSSPSSAPKLSYPPRTSSLAEDSTGRKSFSRKDLFNDPFLGKAGGLVGAPSSAIANSSLAPQSGLLAPLISLPSKYETSSSIPKSFSTSTSKLTASSFSEPYNPVSYPRAYSRSPSPDMKTSNDALEFSDRYPTMEVFDQRMTPPPPSIPVKSFASTSGNPHIPPQTLADKSAMYHQQQPIANYTNPILQQSQHQVPVLPPKPISAAATMPIENRIINWTIEDMNRFPGPSKPTKVPPPLPPKPAPIETSSSEKRVLIRGQHPFILPTSPIGNKFGISGLRNLGNTCFMNSILQCLSATYPFSRYFMDGSYRRHIARNNPLSSQGRVTEAYAAVIRNLWLAEETVVVPTTFKSIIGDILPNFAGTEQQDSQEFLSFLLDQLHEDLNVAKRPFPPNGPDLDSENYSQQEFMMIEWQKYRARNWSIIVDMFQGVLQSVLQCLTCGKTSTTYNMFMYLTLPIPSRNKDGVKNGPVTIYDCLEAFLAIEKLSGGDQWKCPRCKVNRDASKTLSIVRLPTVLLIHFKRFSFQGPFRDKLETVIYYPVKRLELEKYALQSEEGAYSLCAVSNHFGGLNGGHYTAQVKHVHNDRWFNLDDSRVSESSEKSVQTSSAYILFYLCNQNKLSGDWWNSTNP